MLHCKFLSRCTINAVIYSVQGLNDTCSSYDRIFWGKKPEFEETIWSLKSQDITFKMRNQSIPYNLVWQIDSVLHCCYTPVTSKGV